VIYGSKTIKGVAIMNQETELLISDYGPYNPKPYPGDIKPGSYSKAKVNALLKKHKENLDALQFLRDMME